jgi:hypothetical protein
MQVHPRNRGTDCVRLLSGRAEWRFGPQTRVFGVASSGHCPKAWCGDWSARKQVSLVYEAPGRGDGAPMDARRLAEFDRAIAWRRTGDRQPRTECGGAHQGAPKGDRISPRFLGWGSHQDGPWLLAGGHSSDRSARLDANAHWLRPRAPNGDGAFSWSGTETVRDGASHQRGPGRQPAGEPSVATGPTREGYRHVL